MLIFQYPFVINALILCFILTGIHTYLGYHVVKREVIFVDLALAQVAALGAGFGIMLGIGRDHPAGNYLISLGFTLLGAFLFALFRSRKKVIPIEALIGITYAGAIALSFIVLERSATGTEEIKEMLAGSILTVSYNELLFVAVLYSVIGLIHWFLRNKFFAVTENPEFAVSQKMKIWFWDFVFYGTFGFVVTSSVKVAGVLLVFAFLIIPAVSATVIMTNTVKKIIFGWLFGLTGCVLGLELSLRLDWSPSPTIIVVFIAMLIVTVFAKSLILKIKEGKLKTIN
ncbi:MAG: metal ABC transporter permease [Endomicrobiaceae bacterium]|nr:metal ABC transporter permease [Endomicrobiaceae bacterium]